MLKYMYEIIADLELQIYKIIIDKIKLVKN